MDDVPPQFKKDVEALPDLLRVLLQEELAVGNSICDVSHSHPAPPVGGCVILERQVTTRLRKTGRGLKFREVNSSLYSGQFSDLDERYFILESPLPPPDMPDMDAIRDASNAPRPGRDHPLESSTVRAFRESMVMDFDKWHDGIGYEVALLAQATDTEKNVIAGMLIPPSGWRDVEALAWLGTDTAHEALRKAIHSSTAEVRTAVTRYAPGVATDDERTTLLVKALQHGRFYGDMTSALSQVAKFHPPRVVNALFRGLFVRPGDVACHFAAMLTFIYGKAETDFDWDKRPLFLKFNTDDGAVRQAAFNELCAMLEIDPAETLATVGTHNEE